MSDRITVRRALISVYDKTGVQELAQALAAAGVEIVSTGSTASTIAAVGVPVIPVEQLTGFPECLDGRVKTLHPKVHAGILADRRLESHVQQLQELGVEAFDLVVVNLYPFQATVASGASEDEIVEQIDIGGPSMVRGAAKNHHSVAVVVNPAAYGAVVTALGEGGFSFAQRRALAVEAYRHTAEYDVAVATWLGGVSDAQAAVASGEEPSPFSPWLGQTHSLATTLRYGENPHQAAALYTSGSKSGIANAVQLHGKEMSFNNYVDGDAAIRAAYDHAEPAVAIIKHANPCGIAVGADIAEAHARAHETDPVSAFGGVIAANRVITEAAARQIAEVFTEVVVAPGFEEAALDVLKAKKNIRLLTVERHLSVQELRPVSGGLLVQQVDAIDAVGDKAEQWTLVAGDAADPQTLSDLEFAWRSCRAVKSNAILLASDGAAVGIGMGQVSRVDSCKLAIGRAGAERAAGSVAASDAFFPFADGLEVLLEAGVKAVVSPGGSVRDADVIAAAEKAGATLYFTGTRHFFH